MSNKVNEKIVFLETDGCGNLIKGSNIEVSEKYLKSPSRMVTNGVFVIYRGSGWIFGDNNKDGVISSVITASGGTATVSQTVERSKATEISLSVSAGFTGKFIQASIEVGYGITITDTISKQVSISRTASPGMQLFLKVYAMYHRYDVKRLRNGELIDAGSLYEFSGAWEKYMEVPQGETIDQSLLYEPIVRSVLQEPVQTPVQVIDSEGNLEHILDFDNKISSGSYDHLTLWYPRNTPVGVGFNVNVAGKYNFEVGKAVDMVLYEVITENKPTGVQRKLNKIAQSNANGITTNKMSAQLKGGNSTYMLEIIGDIPVSGNDTFYQIIFTK